MKKSASGFTLVELSIVLLIIGIVSAGVLVGRDLIKAAQIRSQVGQFETYNTAVNTFKTKYNYLPGDIPANEANALGFSARSGVFGSGDNNGYVDTYQRLGGMGSLGGETLFFWTDLAAAGLLEGSFTYNINNTFTAVTVDEIAAVIPRSRLGQNGFVTVYGVGDMSGPGYMREHNFQIITFNGTPPNQQIVVMGYPLITKGPLSPMESFAIDQKMDDGMPNIGIIKAAVHWKDGNPPLGITVEQALDMGYEPTFTECVRDDGTNYLYDTLSDRKETPICGLRIKAGF